MKRPTGPATVVVEVVVEGVRPPKWKGGLARFCRAVLGLLGRGGEIASSPLRRCTHDGAQFPLPGEGQADGCPVVFPAAPRRAFPPGRGGVPAGDIAISLETLARNAAEWGVSEDEELKRLAVHGILHLAGMDHGSGKGSAMMRTQGRLLKKLEGEHIIR